MEVLDSEETVLKKREVLDSEENAREYLILEAKIERFLASPKPTKSESEDQNHIFSPAALNFSEYYFLLMSLSRTSVFYSVAFS